LKIISESVRRPLLLRKRPGKQARNQGGFAPPYKFFRPSWKYVLDILWNYWTCSKKFGPLSENSSPLLVSQAGCGPASKLGYGENAIGQNVYAY